jgi:alpha 1,3-glucosidase
MLATITGFPAMPPYYSLGIHYSKWEADITANTIMNYNEKFEDNEFPVDVFWLDIGYSSESRYFTFDQRRFS